MIFQVTFTHGQPVLILDQSSMHDSYPAGSCLFQRPTLRSGTSLCRSSSEALQIPFPDNYFNIKHVIDTDNSLFVYLRRLEHGTGSLTEEIPYSEVMLSMIVDQLRIGNDLANP